MKKKIISVVLASLLTVASLAGCGSAAKADTNNTNGTLVVGTNAAFPPFEYVGDDGEPDGFDMALIKAVGEKIGMDVQIQDMEFDSLVSSIGSKIDVAIAGMTVTEERQKTVDFSESYYEAVQAVIVPKDSAIANADDLKNLTIGVQLGTTGEFIADEIEGVNVSAYNKAVDAVNDKLDQSVITYENYFGSETDQYYMPSATVTIKGEKSETYGVDTKGSLVKINKENAQDYVSSQGGALVAN